MLRLVSVCGGIRLAGKSSGLKADRERGKETREEEDWRQGRNGMHTEEACLSSRRLWMKEDGRGSGRGLYKGDYSVK